MSANHDLFRVFERYVNSKDNQTTDRKLRMIALFERYVNSKDNQTGGRDEEDQQAFERYVNSKDNQTALNVSICVSGLRDM